MSAKLTVHDPDIMQLVNDGYEIDIQHNHLLVFSVPYVTTNKRIAFGTLVSPYQINSKPNNHVVSFKGDAPCTAQGQPLNQLVNNSTPKTLFDQFEIQHQFSNKPDGIADFPATYYAKMVHYINLLTAQARVIDPEVSARTGKTIDFSKENSVFRYGDTASARAGVMAISQKLAMNRIGIIGLGGTGSYILDQIAKTHAKEIHIFDGDDFKFHNAFRAPGAASLDTLKQNLKKVDYFYEMYNHMRTGILCHPYFLDEKNITELAEFDFIFVSVDNGMSRSLICKYLQEAGIAFIDVGMGLTKTDDMKLSGLCRVTLGTQQAQNHLKRCLPVEDDKNDDVYHSNIQTADMNALNAIIAVMRWKQFCEFYADVENVYHLTFSVSQLSLVRVEKQDGAFL